MNALKNNERGLSLVEVTIMLLVLMLLTSVLAPSIADFINDAKWVKVKEDCEAIGLTTMRLTRNVGPCVKFHANQPCSMYNRADLLYSDGPAPDASSVSGGALYNPNVAGGSLNWDTSSRADTMINQFVTNDGPAYPTPTSAGTSQSGLQFGLGWRGAYLSGPLGPDPWGHAYVVNSAFLATAMDAGCTSGCEGTTTGGWSYDTFCLSAGPNGLYESPISGNANGGHVRSGDDFTYVISGGTR
jgi:hypothetical protein